MSEQTITPNSEYVKPCVKCGAQERDARGACKACARDRTHRHRKANPNYQREYQKANVENIVAYHRKWREANPDKVSAYSRKHYYANLEKARDGVRKRVSKYYEANPHKLCERNRKYYEVNANKIKVHKQNRRARIEGGGGKLSKDIAQRLMTLQKGKCACGCGALLKNTGYHLDHIMPVALGGKNTDDNIQLLTPKCNLRKSAKHPDDWARENGRLI